MWVLQKRYTSEASDETTEFLSRQRRCTVFPIPVDLRISLAGFLFFSLFKICIFSSAATSPC